MPVDGSSKPRVLTSGKQGATHSPILNMQANLAAWLELDTDGHESDRHKIVVYDLQKNVRFTLTQDWDRSPDALSVSDCAYLVCNVSPYALVPFQFSSKGDMIYFTAGDRARIKVYAMLIPETPSQSTTHPKFPAPYSIPVAFTNSGAASGIQAMSNGRILFTRSSMMSPNDVFMLENVQSINFHASPAEIEAQVRKEIKIHQLTKFSDSDLQGKMMNPADEISFEGADGRTVQGWINKPPGFKEGEKKKWPVVMLIHGGKFSTSRDGKRED